MFPSPHIPRSVQVGEYAYVFILLLYMCTYTVQVEVTRPRKAACQLCYQEEPLPSATPTEGSLVLQACFADASAENILLR